VYETENADVAEALDVYIDLRIKSRPRNGKRRAMVEVYESVT